MQKAAFGKRGETATELLERLKTRGLIVGDVPGAYHALKRIGYYRLSGYMLPFRTGHQPDPRQFWPGVTFE